MKNYFFWIILSLIFFASCKRCIVEPVKAPQTSISKDTVLNPESSIDPKLMEDRIKAHELELFIKANGKRRLIAWKVGSDCCNEYDSTSWDLQKRLQDGFNVGTDDITFDFVKTGHISKRRYLYFGCYDIFVITGREPECVSCLPDWEQKTPKIMQRLNVHLIVIYGEKRFEWPNCQIQIIRHYSSPPEWYDSYTWTTKKIELVLK